jgi:Chaperone of endosialidase
MSRFASIAALVALFALFLDIPPSSGQGVNPTVSDNSANTAGGSFALGDAFNVSGNGEGNTAFGDFALLFTTSGNFNTAVGDLALEHNDVGSNNTACGAFALNQSTGNNNTATGTSALTQNTTGNGNTASGVFALQLNTDGSSNTAVGFKALKKSTGTKNIGIGYQAGATLSSGSNNIYIGNVGGGDESQTIRIGTAQMGTFIAGIANATVGNAATVIIDTATGKLGIPTSSVRYKQNVAPMGARSAGVLQLRPVTFAYKDEAPNTTHYCLIAEEVAEVYPELVTRTAAGEVQTVKYQELIVMLLNELQRQQQELAGLRALVGQRQAARTDE